MSGARTSISSWRCFEEMVRGGRGTVTVRGRNTVRLPRRPARAPPKSAAHTARLGCLADARPWCFAPLSAVRGAGTKSETQCLCAGAVVMRTETLGLDIPPGLDDGARIRIAGKGHAGPRGAESGDLFVTVRVQPHPIFRREGADLHVTVPVAVHEAALGAKIDVPSLEGPAKLRVPPGTQSGQRFRLRDRGVITRAEHRGDLVVEVRLVLPRLLDERSKELLREFGRINSDDVRAELDHLKRHDG